MSMQKRIPEIVGVLALILAGGCDTLDIANPNAPDTPHLLASPSSVEAVAQGAMKTWYLTTQGRSEEHTSELQSRLHLVCRLLLEKKKKTLKRHVTATLQTIMLHYL